MSTDEKVYPIGVDIYVEKGELKTAMTEAVENILFAAFPDLDDSRDAVLTERLASLVKIKAAMDNAEHFANLALDFYESIQGTGHPQLMEMFTPRNVVIFHTAIRILVTNTITKLMAVADPDEQMAMAQLRADCEQRIWENLGGAERDREGGSLQQPKEHTLDGLTAEMATVFDDDEGDYHAEYYFDDEGHEDLGSEDLGDDGGFDKGPISSSGKPTLH